MTSHIAVIGGGLMGRGIALALGDGGYRVSVVEPVAGIAAQVEVMAHPRIALRELDDAVSDCELVIEAVSEDVEVKLALWRRIDELAASSTLFATNTSSIDIDELAGALDDPSRLLGLHWFNPAVIVPCVEVVVGARTSEETVVAASALMAAVGKEPIQVRSAPGFVANRLQFALFREALLCLEEGLASPEDIDRIVRTSFGPRLARFGPLLSADLGGLDTYLAILNYLSTHLGARFDPPRILERMVGDGRLGAKSSGGLRELDPAEYAELSAGMADLLAEAYRVEDAASEPRA
ncbi:3-hydroxyacyl-CoA dehydrogenase family protein [Microbacterium sp. BWT-B31]|uniref:3-hydroxyacyl-CoA dehydrogenase family protein n=1 Tax=Microbacterium sp. BWT-B31 TaxID=3232072 RepID=UPI003526E3DD